MTPSPTPIPVSGDVQIFADEECKQYPTVGETYTQLYARVNVPWDFNGAWMIPDVIYCDGPNEVATDDPYLIRFISDFVSDDYNDAFSIGQVIALTAELPVEIPANTPFVITKQ